MKHNMKNNPSNSTRMQLKYLFNLRNKNINFSNGIQPYIAV